jgi:phospho-N-acetylmuramoyl-pentapeptide-transferase
MLVWLWRCWADLSDSGLADPGGRETSVALRALLAAAINLILGLAFGRRMIGWLRGRFLELSQSPSADIERLHAHKRATPTLGGLFLVAGILLSLALLADWRSGYPLLAALTVVGFGCVGLADDLFKIAGGGLSARGKLAGQIAVSAIVALGLYWLERSTLGACVRGLPAGSISLNLGVAMVGCAVLTLVGSSNAVNLTDGLDGLAGGCLTLALVTMGLVAYWAGDPQWARGMGLCDAPGAGEMAVAAAGAVGALIGFLWFNCPPAAVFMGDTGALSLGAFLGLVAIVARQEFLLTVVGGVFVAETLSVVAQVAWYRAFKRRVFLCAPLHHHFQLRGWGEQKVVARFWVAAAMCAVAGLAAIAGPRGGKLAPANPAASALADHRPAR